MIVLIDVIRGPDAGIGYYRQQTLADLELHHVDAVLGGRPAERLVRSIIGGVLEGGMLQNAGIIERNFEITDIAIKYYPRERLLGFDDREQPVALQLGESDLVGLAEAAASGEGYGYREINLNVGCPSDRVRSGRFGACLMAEPDLVARIRADVREEPGALPLLHQITSNEENPFQKLKSDSSPRCLCNSFLY